jgi:hypothetical protein
MTCHAVDWNSFTWAAVASDGTQVPAPHRLRSREDHPPKLPGDHGLGRFNRWTLNAT